MLTAVTAVTILVCNHEKTLISPAVFAGCPVGFVAFNLSAYLQGGVLWPCLLDFMGMTLAVSIKNRQLSHVCGVNCICRPGVFQAQVPILK